MIRRRAGRRFFSPQILQLGVTQTDFDLIGTHSGKFHAQEDQLLASRKDLRAAPTLPMLTGSQLPSLLATRRKVGRRDREAVATRDVPVPLLLSV